MREDLVTSNKTHRYVAVQINGETVRRGDVIDLDGRGFGVVDTLDAPDNVRWLRSRTGETMAVHATTRLSAVRAVKRR
ncbi:hypothetical protein [Streptomyces rectiverticillatus]|uniref:hypothetical protein n=1 Tax=Streptomyces rectiverticillatus TaxID=173860 RepID=UPI0015C3798B|nr:hypothetical protein [Streptomyces rectiverticillatus]